MCFVPIDPHRSHGAMGPMGPVGHTRPVGQTEPMGPMGHTRRKGPMAPWGQGANGAHGAHAAHGAHGVSLGPRRRPAGGQRPAGGERAPTGQRKVQLNESHFKLRKIKYIYIFTYIYTVYININKWHSCPSSCKMPVCVFLSGPWLVWVLGKLNKQIVKLFSFPPSVRV